MIDAVAWSAVKRDTIDEFATFDLNQLGKSGFYDWRNAVSIDAKQFTVQISSMKEGS